MIIFTHHKLQIDPISWSVTLPLAGKACQGQTL
jgi:hypothetical protein